MECYTKFSTYLKKKYGQKVYKISIDAGFTCPNRDGTVSTGGCIYCDEGGNRAPYCSENSSVSEQIEKGIEFLSRRYGVEKFIAYFQAFSNTYADPDKLNEVYGTVNEHEGVVGIAIGTRPDCVSEPVLDVIEGYTAQYEVWIELGIQSFNDKALRAINRGHGTDEIYDAINRIKKRKGINICAHIILGLPGDTHEDYISAAKKISELGLEGVKLHHLHIVKGTVLEEKYKKGGTPLFEVDEYVSLVCDFLEHLDPCIIVQRVMGDGPSGKLIAPLWTTEKAPVLHKIDKEFERRNTYQGIKFSRKL
ncbi:MAG: TIGR01212 family radical SAM protein [Candidatus Ancaeobacter aquaticus]|nr:TIGR01212 family radical SAM protein [Candidatus Ancaeobacter aquaticus]